MTIAWFNGMGPPDPVAHRGGAPVGLLAELPAVERMAVLSLRLWCDGTAARAQMVGDYTRAFGTPRADQELEHLAGLIKLVLQGGRRVLMRHGLDCPCFGGDESVFANMVAAGAAGDRDEAMVFALVLMSPQAAFAAVPLAVPVGLALLGLVRSLGGPTSGFTTH